MKHRLFKLALFLILGVIINVAIAWGCVLSPHAERKGGPTGGIRLRNVGYEWISPEGYETHIDRRAGEMRLWQIRGLFASAYVGERPQQLSDTEYSDLIPNWSAFAKYDPFAKYKNADSFTEVAAGWPLLGLHFFGPWNSLSRWRVLQNLKVNDLDLEVKGRFEVNWSDNSWNYELPYLPIWPGFAINTIFYAAILWLLTLGPFTARRMIRRKRGRCIKCGYDLRSKSEGGCPECGWGRESEA